MDTTDKQVGNCVPPEDKKLAEAVLKHLCLEAQIDGIRFGPVLQLLLTDHTSRKPLIKGQVSLNLASRWAVFEERPDVFPDSEEQLLELGVEEELRQLCALRELRITNTELGECQPHLILTLEDGKIFFLNGRSDRYEPWQLGVAFTDPSEIWLLVACPGGGVAVWAPQEFLVGLDYTKNPEI